ncbi:retention module-containing protein, partial [Paraglaciecola psychrophila]
MENFTTLKDTQIVDVSGLVQSATDQNTALQKGDNLVAGKVLILAQDSEVTLIFEDGTEQLITGTPDEILATNDQISQQASTLTPSQTLNGETPNNVQGDIDAIQASIESGDDIDLPDTTAGGLTGNEGTDFVSLDRQGNELLAGAGYETAELDNTLATIEDLELFARVTQPTLTQSDVNVVAEDTTASGNVLDNDSNADDVLTIQSYTVAGDPNLYLSGQTATVENGSLTVNGDGSYTFIPADDWNGELPVVNYLTNTNALDTLSISVTPVNDVPVIRTQDTSVTED